VTPHIPAGVQDADHQYPVTALPIEDQMPSLEKARKRRPHSTALAPEGLCGFGGGFGVLPRQELVEVFYGRPQVQAFEIKHLKRCTS